MRVLTLAVAALVSLGLAATAQARRPVIAYLDAGGKLALYDSETSTAVPAPNITPANPRYFAVSANGRFIFYRDAQKKLHLYDRQVDGERTLPGINVFANPDRPSVSNDGLLAFDGGDQQARVYNSSSGQFVNTGFDANSGQRQSALSADGKFLATTCVTGGAKCVGENPADSDSDSDMFVQNLTTRTDTHLPDLGGATDKDLEHPCMNGDGSLVGADVGNADVVLYSRSTSADVTPASAKSSTATEVHCVLSADGRYLGFDDNAGVLKMWDRTANQFVTLPATVTAPAFFTSPYAKPAPPPPTPTGPSPGELAITGFRGDRDHVDGSFLAIFDQSLADPNGLRSAALGHIADSSRPIRYAAIYALSLVAAPGPANAALHGLLGSHDLNARVLAASALAGSGDKAGIPVLIAALGAKPRLWWRDPPQRAWELARTVLLFYTREKLGLPSAHTFRAVKRARSKWKRWWARNGAKIAWNPSRHLYGRGGGQPKVAARPPLHAATSSGGADASVSGDTATITVDVHVFGPAVLGAGRGNTIPLSLLAARWKSAAERRLNASFGPRTYVDSCGRELHIKWKVNVKTAPLSFRGLDRSRANQIVATDQPWVRSGQATPPDGPSKGGRDGPGSYTGNSHGVWTTGLTPRDVAHEVAHLGGLGDDYTDPPGGGFSKGLPGRQGTLMFDGARVDQKLVDRLGKLLEKAGKIPKCRKKLRGYKFSGLKMRWNDTCTGACAPRPRVHASAAGNYLSYEFSAHVCGDPFSTSWTGKIHYVSHNSLGDTARTWNWVPSTAGFFSSEGGAPASLRFDAQNLRVTLRPFVYDTYYKPEAATASVPVTEDKSCPKRK